MTGDDAGPTSGTGGMHVPAPTDLRRWVFSDLGSTATAKQLSEVFSSLDLGGWSIEGSRYRYKILGSDDKQIVDLGTAVTIGEGDVRHAQFLLAGRVAEVAEVSRAFVQAAFDGAGVEGLNLRVVALAQGDWQLAREAQIATKADLDATDDSLPETILPGADPPGWIDEIANRSGWATLGTFRFPRSPTQREQNLVGSLFSSNSFLRAMPIFSSMPVGQFANLEGRATDALLVLSGTGVGAMVHYDDGQTPPRTVLVPFADLKTVTPERRMIQGQVHVTGTGSVGGFTVGMLGKKEVEPFAEEAIRVHKMWTSYEGSLD